MYNNSSWYLTHLISYNKELVYKLLDYKLKEKPIKKESYPVKKLSLKYYFADFYKNKC